MGCSVPSSFGEAVAALRAGKPVVFPTDTVYGIGVAVGCAASPQALYEAKGRPAGKPIAWLVSSIDDLGRYGKAVPEYAWDLAREGWPGALTLVVRASDAVPEAYRSPEGTIALRVPASEMALQLIAAVGCPLATTSANLAGGEAPGLLAEVEPELLRACGAAVESGERCAGEPSVIIDCTDDAPARLR